LPGKDQEDPDNGKPAATPGRKASGLGGKVAGLPKDDGSMDSALFQQQHCAAFRSCRRRAVLLPRVHAPGQV